MLSPLMPQSTAPHARQTQEYTVEEEAEKIIDLQKKDIDASTCFWENKSNRLKNVKRDLKMRKIHSPCKCRVKVKRNGESCKHAGQCGNVLNEPVIIARDEEAAKSRDYLVAEEVKKLDEMGAAIGVELNGCHDQMKELVTNMGEKFLYD
ncbi:hypothetical protein LXL04_032072 [Taraxacum kok-saghyz]